MDAFALMIHQMRIGVLAQDVTFSRHVHQTAYGNRTLYMCVRGLATVSSNTRPFVTNFRPACQERSNVSVLSWQVCYGCSVEEGCLEFSELIVSPHYETIGGDVLSSILTQYKDTTCSSAHNTIRYGDTTSLNALPLCEKLGLVRSSNPSLSRVELRLQTVKEPLED